MMRALKLPGCCGALMAFAAMQGAAHADLVIAKKPTSNMSCSGGICNATAADAVLNVTDLTNMLATSDVHVFAEGVATDITVADAFGWASSHPLTLGAYGSVNVKAAISVTGTSGLTITANAAGTDGIFRLVGVGQISFWDTSSTLVINGANYTLVNNLPALISAIAANPAGTYAFANTYNAAQDGSYLHSPIPTTFTGIFEGLGNAIGNLTIYNPNSGNENIALFSQVGTGGQLSDINLTNVSIQSNTGPVATLAVLNNGTITHATVSGAVSPASGGYLYTASALVYDNEAAITRSHTAVNVSASDYSAGLVVENHGTVSISDSSGAASSGYAAAGLVVDNYGTVSFGSATGPVTAAIAGGLVDTNDGTISNSNASGAVSSTGGDAGGLVSEMTGGTISSSYALGNVTDSSTNGVSAGGLVGAIEAGSVQSSFATGAVAIGQTLPGKKHHRSRHAPPRKFPGNYVGGLVGYSNGAIAYSYAIGSVTGKTSPQGKTSSIGGLVGKAATSNSMNVSYSLGHVALDEKKFLGGVVGTDASGKNGTVYWDFDTSGIDNRYQGDGDVPGDKGLKGLSDGKFHNGTLLRHLGGAWAQNAGINNGYPYLIANPPPPQ